MQGFRGGLLTGLLLPQEFLVLLVNPNQNDGLCKDCEDDDEENLDDRKFCCNELLLQRREEDEQCDDTEYRHERTNDFLKNVTFNMCGDGRPPLYFQNTDQPL